MKAWTELPRLERLATHWQVTTDTNVRDEPDYQSSIIIIMATLLGLVLWNGQNPIRAREHTGM